MAKLKAAPEPPPAEPVLRIVSDQPATPRRLRPASPRPPRPARRPRAVERCAVHWWRGYVKSEFYAAKEDDGEARQIAISPPFRWRKTTPPPEHGAATHALAALAEQLEQAGWRQAGKGEDWFALRFRRRTPRKATGTDTST
jgi:hypothetical protein